MIDYPEFITHKTVLAKKINKLYLRTWFRATINPIGTETITYIGMNPSKANKITSDDTVNKLLWFTKELSEIDENEINIKNVIITNIVPFYTPKSKELKSKVDFVISEYGTENFEKLMEINLQRIIKAMSISKYVVLGWGNCYINELMHRSLTSSILEELNKMEKEFYVFHFSNESSILTLSGQPRHFGYTNLPDGIITARIKPYYFLNV